MKTLCFLAVCSFLSSLLLTGIVRRAFQRLKMLDRPNSSRNCHANPVPRVGGISIALSYTSAYGLLLLFNSQHVGHLITDQFSLVVRLLPAACVVFATGLLDDLRGLKPWHKLVGQFAAAGGAYWAGIRILGVADHQVHWWSAPLTIVWLVACSNAFNLIDGLDGLAAGVGMLATLTMVLAALLLGNFPLAVATLPLAGCLLGFLGYNFSPASIFLGDCGSLFIGFLLGCFGVIWSQKSATMLGMTAPLLAMTIPVLDVGLSIVRRFLRHQPIFTGDRGHIHHRLLALGLTPRYVALLLYGVCGVGAACSLLQSVANARFAGGAVVLFCAMIWIGVQQLKYVEFGVVRQMLMRGDFRRILQAKIHLEVFEDVISRKRNILECWPELQDTCRELGFSHVSLQVGGAQLEDTFDEPDNPEDWHIRIALSPDESIIVRHPMDSPLQAMIVVPFMETMHRHMTQKTPTQETPTQKTPAPGSLTDTNDSLPRLIPTRGAATV